MMKLIHYFPALMIVAGCVLLPHAVVAADPDRIDFDGQIRPILSDFCYTCHGPDEAERQGELRLDTREGAFANLGDTQVIVAGQPDKSELIRRVGSNDDSLRMPPADFGRSLSADQIELLRRWVAEGATWQKHWAFIPPQRPELPSNKQLEWPQNGIDQFILARLEDATLSPSPRASKERLLRRVSLDLTGLPPTHEEIDAFLDDKSPNAYERVVDRLLAAPTYGERMVLPWLDAARYSDTNGYQTDGTRAMWPWRDWLIDAFNKNVPFDKLTIEQIAGDLLDEPTLDQMIATGFNRNHMLNGEGGRIAEESRVDYVVDRLETTGTVWLGLTIGCGRCHDHKYDPISQREFYSMYAYFNNIDETGAVNRRSSTAAPTIELPTEAQTAEKNRLNAEISTLNKKMKTLDDALRAVQPEWEEDARSNFSAFPDPVAASLKISEAKRTAEQKKLVNDHYLAQSSARQALSKLLDAQKKKLSNLTNGILITMVMSEREEVRETFVLARGEYNKPTEKVQPGIPASLPPLPKDVPNNRLGLAQWLVDRRNPLTARVTVNRAWQLFFGRGLVETSEDFGTQGTRPSHPKLLDWLAREFMIDWDLKRLHKLIVTSATYQQSSKLTPQSAQHDGENRLYSRGARYRLSSFAIRDQALMLAGLLNQETGGRPVKPYQPEGIWADFSFGKIVYKQDHGSDLYRRSLYTFWRRSVGPTMMFDTSSRQVCTVRPRRNNTPLHALTTFNEITYAEAARRFAERIMTEGGSTPVGRLEWAFRTATGRPPQPREVDILLKRFKAVLSDYSSNLESAELAVSIGESPRDETLDVAEHAAWTAIASLLLNLDEVLNKG